MNYKLNKQINTVEITRASSLDEVDNITVFSSFMKAKKQAKTYLKFQKNKIQDSLYQLNQLKTHHL